MASLLGCTREYSLNPNTVTGNPKTPSRTHSAPIPVSFIIPSSRPTNPTASPPSSHHRSPLSSLHTANRRNHLPTHGNTRSPRMTTSPPNMPSQDVVSSTNNPDPSPTEIQPRGRDPSVRSVEIDSYGDDIITTTGLPNSTWSSLAMLGMAGSGVSGLSRQGNCGNEILRGSTGLDRNGTGPSSGGDGLSYGSAATFVRARIERERKSEQENRHQQRESMRILSTSRAEASDTEQIRSRQDSAIPPQPLQNLINIGQSANHIPPPLRRIPSASSFLLKPRLPAAAMAIKKAREQEKQKEKDLERDVIEGSSRDALQSDTTAVGARLNCGRKERTGNEEIVVGEGDEVGGRNGGQVLNGDRDRHRNLRGNVGGSRPVTNPDEHSQLGNNRPRSKHPLNRLHRPPSPTSPISHRRGRQEPTPPPSFTSSQVIPQQHRRRQRTITPPFAANTIPFALTTKPKEFAPLRQQIGIDGGSEKKGCQPRLGSVSEVNACHSEILLHTANTSMDREVERMRRKGLLRFDEWSKYERRMIRRRREIALHHHNLYRQELSVTGAILPKGTVLLQLMVKVKGQKGARRKQRNGYGQMVTTKEWIPGWAGSEYRYVLGGDDEGMRKGRMMSTSEERDLCRDLGFRPSFPDPFLGSDLDE